MESFLFLYQEKRFDSSYKIFKTEESEKLKNLLGFIEKSNCFKYLNWNDLMDEKYKKEKNICFLYTSIIYIVPNKDSLYGDKFLNFDFIEKEDKSINIRCVLSEDKEYLYDNFEDIKSKNDSKLLEFKKHFKEIDKESISGFSYIFSIGNEFYEKTSIP